MAQFNQAQRLSRPAARRPAVGAGHDALRLDLDWRSTTEPAAETTTPSLMSDITGGLQALGGAFGAGGPFARRLARCPAQTGTSRPTSARSASTRRPACRSVQLPLQGRPEELPEGDRADGRGRDAGRAARGQDGRRASADRTGDAHRRHERARRDGRERQRALDPAAPHAGRGRRLLDPRAGPARRQRRRWASTARSARACGPSACGHRRACRASREACVADLSDFNPAFASKLDALKAALTTSRASATPSTRAIARPSTRGACTPIIWRNRAASRCPIRTMKRPPSSRRHGVRSTTTGSPPTSRSRTRPTIRVSRRMAPQFGLTGIGASDKGHIQTGGRPRRRHQPVSPRWLAARQPASANSGRGRLCRAIGRAAGLDDAGNDPQFAARHRPERRERRPQHRQHPRHDLERAGAGQRPDHHRHVERLRPQGWRRPEAIPDADGCARATCRSRWRA